MAEIDHLKGAKERSIKARQKLANMAGEMLTSTEASKLLGLDPQAVEQLQLRRKLIAVHMTSDWLYPAFQFSADDILPGIERVIAAHEGSDPWVMIDILLAPADTFCDRSLLHAIRDGDEQVIESHLGQTKGDGFG